MLVYLLLFFASLFLALARNKVELIPVWVLIGIAYLINN